MNLSAEPDHATTVAAPTQDRRTRRREQLRNRVFHAAVDLIVEQGFDNTTMDEIADRADVARATVFNHFERKTAFIDEWAARRRKRALQAVYASRLEDDGARDILVSAMVELARVNTSTRGESVALMTAAVHTTNVLGHPALAGEFADFLARARDEGQIAKSTDPRLGGLLLATGYFAILTEWIEAEPPPFDLEARLLQMLDVVLDGMSTQPKSRAKKPRAATVTAPDPQARTKGAAIRSPRPARRTEM